MYKVWRRRHLKQKTKKMKPKVAFIGRIIQQNEYKGQVLEEKDIFCNLKMKYVKCFGVHFVTLPSPQTEN